MRSRPAFLGKVSSGLLLTILASAPGIASGEAIPACIDIASSPNSVRVLELAATPVNAKFFSLVGVHTPPPGSVAGSATGTAALIGETLIATVNASSVVNSTMEATSYQFNFDTTQTPMLGTFQSITQQSINGTTTAPLNKFGAAALVDCAEPVTTFTGSTPPPVDPPPASNEDPGCYDNDGDFVKCIAAGGNDCNDKDWSVKPSATEICGDGIDQNCDGIDPPCTADNDVDNDGYDSTASGGQDCNDNNPAIRPGATEVCSNSVDDNCNGAVNEGCDTVDNDTDNDGFDSVASGGTDCNDNNAAIKPGVTDSCGDGIDQDCSGADAVCATYPEFTVNNDGSLNQTGTNLTWMKQYAEKNSDGTILNWYSAIDYCRRQTLGGVATWRLPTKQELLGIVDTRQANPNTEIVEPLINPRFDAKAGLFWTSTESFNSVGQSYEAWDVNFGTGVAGVRGKQTYLGAARCVRTR